MTIATSTPARIGNGLMVSGTISGPTAVDDYLAVFSSNNCVYGDVILAGHTTWFCLLGWSERTNNFIAQAESPIDGTAITLNIEARHANGTLFDSVSVGGWTFAPVGNIPALLAKLTGLGISRVFPSS